MPARKQRVTVTVDPGLLDAANRAVETGEADSVSGWVTAAMSEKADRDEKLAMLRAAVADYEAEFGEITNAEIAAVRRADRSGALVVRRRGTAGGKPRRPVRPKSA
jgi:hypothetical protein